MTVDFHCTIDLAGCRALASSWDVSKDSIWFCCRASFVRIWPALASFCMCLWMFRLCTSSSALASYWMIIYCSDIKASADTGVTGDRSAVSCRGGASISDTFVISTRGLDISLSTLSGLDGNNATLLQPARMVLLVEPVSLAELYRAVKCSFPIMFTPLRSMRSPLSL